MVKATMSSILNIFRNIFMRLSGSLEEVVTMCLVCKIWRVYIPPPPPKKEKKILDLDSLSNSLTRELKIRFVGLVL